MPASSATLIIPYCDWSIFRTPYCWECKYTLGYLKSFRKASPGCASFPKMLSSQPYPHWFSSLQWRHPPPLVQLKKKIAIQNSSLRWPKTLALQGNNSISKVQIEIDPERIYLIGLFLIYFLNLKLICSQVPQSTKGWSLECIWTMEVSHSLKGTSSWLIFIVSRRAGTRAGTGHDCQPRDWCSTQAFQWMQNKIPTPPLSLSPCRICPCLPF